MSQKKRSKILKLDPMINRRKPVNFRTSHHIFSDELWAKSTGAKIFSIQYSIVHTSHAIVQAYTRVYIVFNQAILINSAVIIMYILYT